MSTEMDKGKIISELSAYDYLIRGRPVPKILHEKAMSTKGVKRHHPQDESIAGSPFEAPMTSPPESGFK